MREGGIGALRPIMVAAATLVVFSAPAWAASLTVNDITAIEGTGFKLSVPSVTIEDGNFTEDQVRALFGPGGREAFAALADLTASSVSIPEISLTYTTPSSDSGDTLTSTVTYDGFELTNVVNGVAASASLASSSTSATGSVTSNSSWGAVSTGRLDLRALLGFYGIGPGAGSDGISPVFDNFRFTGGKLASSTGGETVQCTLGDMMADNFSARPLKTSLIDISGIANRMQTSAETGAGPDPADVAALVHFYADVLTAMRSTPMSLAGFDCNVVESDGKATSFGTGKVEIGGFEPGVYPPVSVDDIKVKSDDGSMSFGNFTFKKMDFTGPLATLAAAETPDEAWFIANARKLIPALDGLSMRDVSLDAPDPEGGGRVTGTLGNFDVSLGNYVNGVPASISVSAGGLDFPLPPDQTDGPAPELIKAGIDRLHLDFGSSVHWDADAQELVVDQLMVDARQLGRFAISGTLGNATSKLFDDDPDVAMTAMAGLTVKSVTIEVQDYGAGNVLVAAGARDAGQSEPLFRTTLAGMAQGMVLAVLGNSDDAMAAVKALGDFVAGTPQLKVTLTSADPAGLPLAVLAQAEQDPTVLAGKVTVVAEATGTPLTAPSAPAQPATSPETTPDTTAPATEAPAPDTPAQTPDASAPAEAPQAQPAAEAPAAPDEPAQTPDRSAPPGAPVEQPPSPGSPTKAPATESSAPLAAPAGDVGGDTVQQEKLGLKAPPRPR